MFFRHMIGPLCCRLAVPHHAVIERPGTSPAMDDRSDFGVRVRPTGKSRDVASAQTANEAKGENSVGARRATQVARSTASVLGYLRRMAFVT